MSISFHFRKKLIQYLKQQKLKRKRNLPLLKHLIQRLTHQLHIIMIIMMMMILNHFFQNIPLQNVQQTMIMNMFRTVYSFYHFIKINLVDLNIIYRSIFFLFFAINIFVVCFVFFCKNIYLQCLSRFWKQMSTHTGTKKTRKYFSYCFDFH